MCLLTLLNVRNATSPCLHFCCTNNSIIISFLRIRMNQSTKINIFCRKRGVYKLLGCTNYQKLYGSFIQNSQGGGFILEGGAIFDTYSLVLINKLITSALVLYSVTKNAGIDYLILLTSSCCNQLESFSALIKLCLRVLHTNDTFTFN